VIDCRECLARALARPLALTVAELEALLSARDPAIRAALFAAADELKGRLGKREVLPRALIETGNVCAKDCLYCGIRRSATDVRRYRLSAPEILECCAVARQAGYRAMAFQSGELESEENTALYEGLLARLAAEREPPEVTLSLGEQTEAVYARWRAAAKGMTLKYLLRIESSDARLYGAIHPRECSFERRLECLRTLKRLGYVTGSGVMIGIPGQTVRQLAKDIVFFGRERLDMVGMGPYIPVPGTALPLPEFDAAERYELALRMIALVRLYLHDVNIVSATALEALGGEAGRETGLRAGANVVMPRFTPAAHRGDYRLYPQIN